jgi:hypothetical protein
MSNIVIPDGGSIGSASDTDAISISSSGAVTLSSDFVPATPLSHRNLIINGDFRINQRGATSRTQTSSAYNYDRWYWDGTYLYQGVEDKNVRNGTFTLSWTDSGSDITAHYVISTDSSNNNGPNSGLTYTSVSNSGQITVNETTEYSKHLWIRFGGTVANLSKVQLEEGSVATPFEHRSYGEELTKCHRYFQSFGSEHESDQMGFMGIAYSTNSVYIPVTFYQPMRATPTVLSGGGWSTRANNDNTFTANFGLQRIGRYGCILSNSVTLNAAQACWVEMQNQNCKLQFNAEL